MKQTNLWKFFFILFVLAWSLWELYPPKPRSLVMVFTEKAENTDSNFLAIAQQARELEGQFPERSFANLTNAIGTNDISRYFPRIDLTKHPAKNPNRAVLHELQRSAAGQIKLGLDLQGGMSFMVEMDTNKLTNVSERQRALEQAAEVLRRRVDRFGVAEPVIQPAGENQILIQLPGLSEAEKETARTTIAKAAFLEFRMVHPDSDELIRDDIVPVNYVRLTEVRKDRNGREIVNPFIVSKKPERGLTGKYIRNATVSQHPISGALEIDFTLNSEGAELFSQITREYSPRNDKYFLLAITLDGELYSAPRINGPIDGGRAQITGSFTAQEAFALANVLQNPLEAPVKVISEHSVDPTLGKDSIRSGVRAAVIGTILVSAFMLVYYLLAGLVANVALLLNIIILLGVMCYIDTTLTLPGIAGIVLTIGMAVDANVLIFERIREELAAGKSMRGGLAAGYSKAFGTIFDSNLTTLIAAVLLIFLGTGPVKGFGVTLTIGIVISMFTALVVTRLFFDVLLQAGRLKSLRMIQFVKTTHIDFLRWSKPAFALSWLMILIGIGYGFKRGKSVWGVDFAGGDSVTLSFKQEPDVEKIRSAIATLGVGEPQIQFSRDITGTSQKTLQITTAFGSSDKVVRELQTRFPEAGFTPIATAKHGPTVGREIQKSALLATFLAMFGILIYVAFRYEFSFAVGAVVAVVHDVLMTIGWYCLTGREFNAPMVAAILTIIGFSINDTIVIFDRIREDLKLGIRGSFKDLINFALNQTLSRTIITSGTVLLATLSLYLFGGPVINDFAFTFLVGILSGTYSTIYIASALVLWWHKGVRPKSGAQVTVGAATTVARA